MKHNRSSYIHRGCRCDVCTDAQNRYQRDLGRSLAERLARGEVSPPHGTLSTYSNYRCRCDACVEAKSVANKRGAWLRANGYRAEVPS